MRGRQVAMYNDDEHALTRPYESARHHYSDVYDHHGQHAYHIEKHRRTRREHEPHSSFGLHSVKDFAGEHFDAKDPVTWMAGLAGAALGGVTMNKFKKYREDGEEDEYGTAKTFGGAAAGFLLFSELRHQYLKHTLENPEKVERMKRKAKNGAKDLAMGVVKERLRA